MEVLPTCNSWLDKPGRFSTLGEHHYTAAGKIQPVHYVDRRAVVAAYQQRKQVLFEVLTTLRRIPSLLVQDDDVFIFEDDHRLDLPQSIFLWEFEELWLF